MKKIISKIILMLIFTSAFAGAKTNGVSALEYIQKNSSHSSFSVEDGKWIDKEYLSIKNNSSSEIKFKITADFNDDFKSGNIKEKNLTGFFDKGGFQKIFTAKPGSTETFTVYFIGTATEKEMKHNRKAVSKIKIEPVTKKDFVNEYFSFYKYISYSGSGSDFSYTDYDTYLSRMKDYENMLRIRAEEILSGDALSEFNSWLSIPAMFMTQMFDPELYGKIQISELKIEENKNTTAKVTTSYNRPTDEVWKLASKDYEDLQAQIDSDEDYIHTYCEGKWFPSYTVKEKYTFFFDGTGRISKIEKTITDAVYDKVKRDYKMLPALKRYIYENIMKDSQSVVLEKTIKDSAAEIKIIEKFGETQNPFTGETFFRDYVSYPYYSIKKFCSMLDGEIVKIEKKNADTHITVKTADLEIEYFGWMKLNEKLKTGDKIKKGTYLGEMQGGGDSGMKLHIRMKYNGMLIDPSELLES